MSSQLLTIEGIYDGKNIKLLEAVQIDKKHRVLITFLDELEQIGDSVQEMKKEFLYIPTELEKQLKILANAEGIDDLKRFIVDILEEKLQAEKDKEYVFAVTNKIRSGLANAGISEDEVLEDFDQFRRTLKRE